VFCPITSQSVADFLGRIFSVRPEYANTEQILTQGKGRDTSKVVSKGEVHFDFFISVNNLENMN